MATILPSPPRVGMVSLGCPKALVDSERILTKLRADGYQMSPDYAGADVVLVNTCGFLDSAKEESLEAIGEAIAENGRVVVTGCMGREADVIRARFPKVLAITGPQAYDEVVAAVHAAAPPIPNAYLDLVPQADLGAGIKLTPRHYSYVKISEGCNHRCAFCIIPSIRGDLVILLWPGDREDLGEAGADHIGFFPHAAGDDHPAILCNRLADRLEALFLGRIEEAAGVDQDDIGAGIIGRHLIAVGAQLVRMRSESTNALGQPSETMPTRGGEGRTVAMGSGADSGKLWQKRGLAMSGTAG